MMADRDAPSPGEGLRDLGLLVASMEPELSEEEYLFAAVGEGEAGFPSVAPWAVIREREATTLILERPQALACGFPDGPAFRRVTLRVHSSLEAVGLTAVVATTLARLGISANVVAAFFHDHIFVPAGRADEAAAALRGLAARGPEPSFLSPGGRIENSPSPGDR